MANNGDSDDRSMRQRSRVHHITLPPTETVDRMDVEADVAIRNDDSPAVLSHLDSRPESVFHLLRVSGRKVVGSFVKSDFRIPRTVRFDYDFYRLLFLSMQNDDYNVSTIQAFLSFEKFASVLNVRFAKSSARDLASAQNDDKMITWEAYQKLIKTYEDNNKASGGRRLNIIDEYAEVSLDLETTMVLTAPERVYLTIDDSGSSAWAGLINFARFINIILAVVSIVLESLPYYKHPPDCGEVNCYGEPVSADAFRVIELVTTILFAVDFGVRLALVGFVRVELIDRSRIVEMTTGRTKVEASRKFWGRIWAFLFSFQSVVDIVSFLPCFIRLALTDSKSDGLQVFRILRLGSFLRLFRIRQFKDVTIILKHAFSESVLTLGVLFMGYAVVVLFFSVLEFFQEGGTWYPVGSIVNGEIVTTGAYYRPSSPDTSVLELTPFTSIPAAVWWAVITSTTVGYGDVVPTSDLGRFIGGCLAICGVIVLAMPIAVIGSNFTQEYNRFYGIRTQLALYKKKEMQAQVITRYLYDDPEPAGVSEQEQWPASRTPERVSPPVYKQLEILCLSNNAKFVLDELGLIINKQDLAMKDVNMFVAKVLQDQDINADIQKVVLRIAIDLIEHMQ